MTIRAKPPVLTINYPIHILFSHTIDSCLFAVVPQADSAVCSSVCQQGKWVCDSLPTPGACAVEEIGRAHV